MIITVREALRADADRLADLSREFSNINPSPSISAMHDLCRTAEFVPLILAAKHIHVLVAESAGDVVGCAVFSLIPSLVHGGRLLVFVDLVVVEELHQRCGIGKQLMLSVIDYARRHDAYKVVLTTRSDNLPALTLHRSCGLENNGIAMAVYLCDHSVSNHQVGQQDAALDCSSA